MEFKFKIQGLKEIINRLQEATKESVLKEGLSEAAQYIASWSKTQRLSGPRPQQLGVVTGRLRSSIMADKEIHHSGNTYTARIGTNVIYARIHEFGFSGTQIVRAHARRIGTFKIVTSKGRMKKAGSTISFQGVTTRNMNMPARPFLRPAIEDENNKIMILEVITRRIQDALKKQGNA